MEIVESNLYPDITEEQAKELGAYYTDAQIAEFLIWWALRKPESTVLDPSFGGGVFLRCAAKFISKLGGDASSQVFGVELDKKTYSRISRKLSEEFGNIGNNFVCSDFFELDSVYGRKFDSVVGNPPFIRYQRFTGQARKIALQRALAQGVCLTRLSSSWAPFLVHSISMIKEGGRLAMVIPMEITYAVYAKPLLRYLRQTFKKVTFLTFKNKIFPELSEDTLLLLAEGKDKGPAKFLHRDMENVGQLTGIALKDIYPLRGTRALDTEMISDARQRMTEYFIPAKARELYNELKTSKSCFMLGATARVGIGYVTGANDFFHLGSDTARIWDVPARYLKKAVRRSSAFEGIIFSKQDWQKGLASKNACYLLHIDDDRSLPEGVKGYIERGESSGANKSYKCRVRSPWYRVPHVYRTDAFLTYMNGNAPRLVSNRAGAVAPNSLYIIRMKSSSGFSADALASLWQTSLVRLSSEIEGHALGGGMLKLEPCEADKIIMPYVKKQGDALEELAKEMDALIRAGRGSQALGLGDSKILASGLGLSRKDCEILGTAADILKQRRDPKG